VAANIHRTATDDATDALAALDAAARELANWRAHLLRVQRDPTFPAALQARRSAQVVAGVIADAVASTRRAVCHTDVDELVS
jgi:hypothetical protein